MATAAAVTAPGSEGGRGLVSLVDECEALRDAEPGCGAVAACVARLASAEAALAAETRERGAALANIATAYHYLNMPVKAEPLYRGALAALEESRSDAGEIAGVLHGLASLHMELGRHGEAARLLVRVLETEAAGADPDGDNADALRREIGEALDNMRECAAAMNAGAQFNFGLGCGQECA
jgi:tetratricopeptide (TPR) repeat protein